MASATPKGTWVAPGERSRVSALAGCSKDKERATTTGSWEAIRPSSRLRSIAREASPAVPVGAIERIGAIALGPLDHLG